METNKLPSAPPPADDVVMAGRLKEMEKMVSTQLVLQIF